ncbi:MAG: phytoene desaturase family protein [Acidimicrobiia bacterium]
MSEQRYDTVVIGAGIAGMATSAILAKDFGKSVLVLERAPFIGGRAVSFVGKGDKVVADGVEMGVREFKKALAHARTFVGTCYPDLETIFAEGMLDGYTIEAGGHGLFWGNKSRMRCVLDHLGAPVDMPVNTGLAFIDHKNGNTMHQVAPGGKYEWMTDEGYATTLAALRDMATTTPHQMAELMETPLSEWLDERNLHPEAYDYIKVLAASQTAMAEPAMTPTGDFLGYMMAARPIGMNLITGSVATVGEPGPIAIPKAMEQVLLDHGGEIRRSTVVANVIIEDGRATGVEIHTDDGLDTIRADHVICTIPPKYIFNVLPKEVFPSEWVDTLSTKFWGAGLLSAYIALKRDVWADYGIDERSFIYMPDIMSEGYTGAVDMVMAVMSPWGGRRAPEGKRDFVFSTALTDKEMRDPEKVKRVTDWCDEWFRETFPTWEEDMEFCIWTPSPEAYGLWRPVGEDRPDVQSPWVDGLYFAGDQYGRRLWGGGVDGASLSAVLCVDAMEGTNLEEDIFPWYHQGIPELELTM